MKYILFLILTFFAKLAFGQTIYLTSIHKIEIIIKTKNSYSSDIRSLIPGRYVTINADDFLIISSAKNNYSTAYFFDSSSLHHNDTLHLNFLKFHYVDTLKKNWGCMKSKHPEKTNGSKTIITEYNLGAPEPDSIPSSIKLKVNNRTIIMYKKMDRTISMESWNGDIKGGEDCGGYNSLSTISVMYKQ